MSNNQDATTVELNLDEVVGTTMQELAEAEKELGFLEQDYVALEKKYFDVCEALAVAEAKLSKPNRQLKIANDKAEAFQVYCEAFEAFYGELPKSMHQALMIITSNTTMPLKDKIERVLDIVEGYKKQHSFVERLKETLNGKF